MSDHLKRACALHAEAHERLVELVAAKVRELDQEATTAALVAAPPEPSGYSAPPQTEG